MWWPSPVEHARAEAEVQGDVTQRRTTAGSANRYSGCLSHLLATALTLQQTDEENPRLYDDADITPTITQCDVTMRAIVTRPSGGDVIQTEVYPGQSKDDTGCDVTHAAYSLT